MSRTFETKYWESGDWSEEHLYDEAFGPTPTRRRLVGVRLA